MKLLIALLPLLFVLQACVTIETITEQNFVDRGSTIGERATFQVKPLHPIEYWMSQKNVIKGPGYTPSRAGFDQKRSDRVRETIDLAIATRFESKGLKHTPNGGDFVIGYTVNDQMQSMGDTIRSLVSLRIQVMDKSYGEIFFDQEGTYVLHDRFQGNLIQRVVDQVLESFPVIDGEEGTER